MDVTAVAVTGCQWGISFPRSPVSTVAAPPPAGITSIAWPAPLLRANRIRLPSGDHAGWISAVAAVVSRWSVLDESVIVQMSKVPDRLLVNAIRDPSGDQAGWTLRAVPLVSTVIVPPAAGTTQIW